MLTGGGGVSYSALGAPWLLRHPVITQSSTLGVVHAATLELHVSDTKKG